MLQGRACATLVAVVADRSLWCTREQLLAIEAIGMLSNFTDPADRAKKLFFIHHGGIEALVSIVSDRAMLGTNFQDKALEAVWCICGSKEVRMVVLKELEERKTGKDSNYSCACRRQPPCWSTLTSWASCPLPSPPSATPSSHPAPASAPSASCRPSPTLAPSQPKTTWASEPDRPARSAPRRRQRTRGGGCMLPACLTQPLPRWAMPPWR